jgi:hypothetical protein
MLDAEDVVEIPLTLEKATVQPAGSGGLRKSEDIVGKTRR